MYNCPNCNQPTISAWQKFCTGPLSYTECRNCGFRISVPILKYAVSILPLLIGIVLAGEVVHPIAFRFVALVLCLVFSIVVLMKWVPLILKK